MKVKSLMLTSNSYSLLAVSFESLFPIKKSDAQWSNDFEQNFKSATPSLQWKSTFVDFGIGEMKCIDENDIIVINIKNTNIDLCRWYLQKNNGVFKVVYSSKNAQEDFVN